MKAIVPTYNIPLQICTIKTAIEKKNHIPLAVLVGARFEDSGEKLSLAEKWACKRT